METLKYIVVPNPFKDQETSKYDYLGQFIINGTTSLDAACEKIARGRPHIDAALMKLVAGHLFEVIAEEVGENNCRCVIGPLTFATAISGSFPSADGSFSEDNELYVSVTVGDPLRSNVAVLVPETGSSDAVAVKIYGVEDAASHEIGVVHGTATAVVTGKNISASQPGESIVLADLETGLAVSTGTVVAEDGLGQRLDVNFAAPFAAGDYWLVLTTRGYATPDASPESYRKKVKALAAPPPPVVPTIAKVVDVQHLDSPTDYVGSDQTGIQLAGENLALAGYQLTMEYRTSAEAAWQAFSSYEVAQATASAISLTSQATAAQLGASDYRFTVTNSKGTATRTVAISA